MAVITDRMGLVEEYEFFGRYCTFWYSNLHKYCSIICVVKKLVIPSV